MIAYVDSSAVIERVLDEPGAEVVLDVWIRADEVVSSQALYPEIRAALAVMREAGALDEREHGRVVSHVESVLADVRAIPVDAKVAMAAGRLAERHGLDCLTAIHLAAALGVDAPRIVVTTWDRALAAAASEHGMPVVPRVPAPAAA